MNFLGACFLLFQLFLATCAIVGFFMAIGVGFMMFAVKMGLK